MSFALIRLLEIELFKQSERNEILKSVFGDYHHTPEVASSLTSRDQLYNEDVISRLAVADIADGIITSLGVIALTRESRDILQRHGKRFNPFDIVVL